eukprot:COSAG01_NODE_19075_length_1032_cov_1.251876_2_plen_46_part_01
MRPENYWSIRHSVLPFSADPRSRLTAGGHVASPCKKQANEQQATGR